MSQGVSFPAVYALWCKWAPPSEKTQLLNFTLSGMYLGTVFAFPISGMHPMGFIVRCSYVRYIGWLCGSSFLGGWPAVFYVFGGVGILWCIAWTYFISSSPETYTSLCVI